jgi:hypothetical protein
LLVQPQHCRRGGRPLLHCACRPRANTSW